MNTVSPIGRIVSIASIAGILTTISAGAAFAQTSSTATSVQPDGRHHSQQGWVGRALQLDSLSHAQRAAIEQLAQDQRAARTPVRQADARLLTTLAQQVESGAIDRQALAPGVQARQTAALAARAEERDVIQKLHDLLTPAQRSALVDSVESLAQGPSAQGPGDGGGARRDRLDRVAARLGLTPSQRQQIASNLKAERAEHGQHGQHGGETHPSEADRVARRERRKAWLESFRDDEFRVSSGVGDGGQPAMDRRMARAQDLLQAAVPVLTPAQRAQVASRLRARAAHET